jgi:4-hydroxythreonine-4-phosphate dehydrogenase
MSTAADARPLVLTPGDPAGIGPEIALAAWRRRATAAVPPFALLDDPDRIAALAERLFGDVPVRAIDRLDAAATVFREALPVVAHPWPRAVTPGTPEPSNGRAVIGGIDRAVALVQSGEAAGVVTNPIAKHVLQAAGFAHPGHTDYLAELGADRTGAEPTPVMMLACPDLRVVLVTVHMPLADVPRAVTPDRIATTARITLDALQRDFGVAAPRLAVAGLNPHAGENGTMGREEIDVIEPALDRLRGEGWTIDGPRSADTMFYADARAGYDAALCMYHDQALIPLKTLDFARGVNITLGLPFVRTSPDHGTAFGLAGTGTADPTSLIEALRTARQLAANRARAADAAA